ncbi:MAG: hypothetical protein IKC24_01140, partial [Oscillospiraceae bacterium]|nr:hypothetical protein [Oscillospiraceae bacterium]
SDSTGRKGVCGKPRKGVLHLSNKKFLELFASSKNLHSGAKYFFDTLKAAVFRRFFLPFSPSSATMKAMMILRRN